MNPNRPRQGTLNVAPRPSLPVRHALTHLDERRNIRPELVAEDATTVTIRLTHNELDRLAGVRR